MAVEEVRQGDGSHFSKLNILSKVNEIITKGKTFITQQTLTTVAYFLRKKWQPTLSKLPKAIK